MSSRVALKQFRQDGASQDDAIRWNSTTGRWEPAPIPTCEDCLHRLIITTWGGIVYDTDGELVLKES